MKTLEIYDPAMCCSTGVCGTDVDPKLAQFASDLTWLQQKGVKVSRFNLAQQPAAFAGNSVVKDALHSMGNECLPLVLVNGAIATRSIYPNREQLVALTGIEADSPDCCSAEEKESGSCCGGEENSGCC